MSSNLATKAIMMGAMSAAYEAGFVAAADLTKRQDVYETIGSEEFNQTFKDNISVIEDKINQHAKYYLTQMLIAEADKEGL